VPLVLPPGRDIDPLPAAPMRTVSGDAMIFASAPDQVIIYIRQRPQEPVPIDPPGQDWQGWVSRARETLAAAGWRLDTWHRPRGNPSVLATAFVWRWP
jgi:hypothetical protein